MWTCLPGGDSVVADSVQEPEVTKFLSDGVGLFQIRERCRTFTTLADSARPSDGAEFSPTLMTMPWRTSLIVIFQHMYWTQLIDQYDTNHSVSKVYFLSKNQLFDETTEQKVNLNWLFLGGKSSKLFEISRSNWSKSQKWAIGHIHILAKKNLDFWHENSNI